jgi:hypothetical protein
LGGTVVFLYGDVHVASGLTLYSARHYRVHGLAVVLDKPCEDSLVLRMFS